MDKRLTALKRRIGTTRRDARGYRRYAERLRVEVVEYTLQREDGGDTLASVARELGLTQRTLWGWVRRTRESVLRPVELIDEVPEVEPEVRVLALPNGLRIEGLSIDDVITLVRELS